MSQAWMTWAFFSFYLFTPLPTSAWRGFWQSSDSHGPRGWSRAIWGSKLGNYPAHCGHRRVPFAAATAKKCACAWACKCVWMGVFFFCVYVGSLGFAPHTRTARVATVICFYRNPSLSCGGKNNGQLNSLQSVCLSRSQFSPPKNPPLKLQGLNVRRDSGLAVSEHFIHTQGLGSKAMETSLSTQEI